MLTAKEKWFQKVSDQRADGSCVLLNLLGPSGSFLNQP